jgi:hypothetical protein
MPATASTSIGGTGHGSSAYHTPGADARCVWPCPNLTQVSGAAEERVIALSIGKRFYFRRYVRIRTHERLENGRWAVALRSGEQDYPSSFSSSEDAPTNWHACAQKCLRMEKGTATFLFHHKHQATGRLHIIAEKMSLSTAGKTCFVVKRVRPFSLDDKYRHFHSNPPPPLTRLLYIFSKGYMSSSQKWVIMGA